MKIFDFNIHLPTIEHEDVNIVISSDLNLTFKDIEVGFEVNSEILQKLDNYNVLLFNTKLFENNLVNLSSLKRHSAVYTALIDFRRFDLIEYLEKAKQSGIKAIMFNSYLQRISEGDYISILQACKFAEQNNIIVCIDGSFGTSKMYVYDNLKLACFISDFIKKIPIVIVHSGGRRILDFMLLADENKNIWFDTSFSLPYYIGSSLEKDFEFSYKKIGTHRVVFGSDIPYVNFEKVFNTHMTFFQNHNFSSKEIDSIFYHNSLNLFS